MASLAHPTTQPTAPDASNDRPARDAHRLEHDRLLARSGLALLLLPLLWFLRSDIRMLVEGLGSANLRMTVRGIYAMWLMWGVWLLRRPMARVAYERTLLMLMWGIVVGHVALSLLRPAGDTMPMRSALLILAPLYLTFPVSGWRQALPPVVGSLALIIIRLVYLTGAAAGDIQGDIVVIIAFNGMGLLMIRRRAILEADESRAWDAEREARESAERALGELKTLRGIIPICAHCKHVRTEAGAWEQVEQYIVARTDVDFSHGICPNCMDEHYPEEDGQPAGA